jgi:Cu-Zn family superoxide dismutase
LINILDIMLRNRLFSVGFSLSAAAFASSTSFASSSKSIKDTAIVVLGPLPTDKNDSGVRGIVTFTQSRAGSSSSSPSKAVVVKASLTGLKPGKHGFHIHSLGDLSKGCASAGGHFNPIGASHGGPSDSYENRHVGDLGNVIADENGNVEVTFEDSLITLSGELSIIGRSVVIHADEDDLGKGGFPDSKTTGHAGSRISCGVIGRGEEIVE